ncbi:MAG: DUF4369 domain-containing protein [Lutimonas sp.]
MKKIALWMLVVVLAMACSRDADNTMYVKGTIKGLKKGTLYLQKQNDSLIVSVDSVFVDGTDTFVLEDEIESPEMYYLALGSGNKKIPFFGEKDTVSISSDLEKFALKAKISGSENQARLDKYYEMVTKFNDQNLDLIKEEFEARKKGSVDSIAAVEKKMKNWTRRKYLYTTNFAVNNGSFEVSPYIALTELTDANVALLDTINSSLSEQVKDSKYGKQLDRFITSIKENQPTASQPD